MIGSRHSRSFHSGTPEHPTQSDLIRALVQDLLAGSRSWVHFESTDPTHFLEIADDVDSLLVNLAFPFARPLNDVFHESGITVPAAWQHTAHRRQGWWSSGYVMFSVPRDDPKSLVAFSEAVFRRLFQVGEDQPIKGWLDG